MAALTPILEFSLEYLEQKNAAHAARLRRRLEQADPEDLAQASKFFTRYQSYIEKAGKSLSYGLDCYVQLVEHMVHERLEFLRSGRYANSSFAEVERQLYLNPEAFEYHMHGLVFAQFFWPDQAARFQFFAKQIRSRLTGKKRYLEIGGGHGLYIIEAISQAPPDMQFQLIDISPSSMELVQGIAEGLAIDFRLMNIFDYVPEEKFDFIALGEVIEHLEDPLALLRRVRELLAPDGTVFITTPANAPTIDHIYLFNSVDEIRAMLNEAGFSVLDECVAFGEPVTAERARKLKVAVMFAAFVGKRDAGG